MRTFSDFYFLPFHFWFRFDLLTKRRENKALKAFGAITVIQCWVVLGGYWWAEMLLGLPAPPRSVFAMGAVAVLAESLEDAASRAWRTAAGSPASGVHYW